MNISIQLHLYAPGCLTAICLLLLLLLESSLFSVDVLQYELGGLGLVIINVLIQMFMNVFIVFRV